MQERSAVTLVTTKLTAPSPPANLVDRPRLAAALDTAMDDPNRRVALVSAPAGSGKSTLVASWMATRPEPTAWLQIDDADRDPARFWTYFVAALSSAAPELAELIRPAMAAAAGDPESLIGRMVNELSRQTESIIVAVDDYHLLANPVIDGGVERLIELAPPTLNLVLCTRVDPPLRLSRLRVRDQLTEIRADDLRFTSEEAGPVLAGRANGSVAARHVEALCERTEGWAAGLVLAGMSLASATDHDSFVAAFQGDDRLVVDYLSDEFLSGISAEDRNRLLRTSVLDRLCGPLVDSVCDVSDGVSWLRETAESNQLVIGLDRTATWFRYHHLLRDLLRLEATMAIGDEIAELHRRAGVWHQAKGDLNSAVEHMLAAGELDIAADLIADNATKLLNGGHLFTVLRQLDQLGDVIDQHAGCCIVRGWTTFVAGRFAEAEIWLERARRLDRDGVDAGLITALGTMVHVARGDVAGGLAIAADSPTPSDPTHAMVMGGILVWAGRFDEARPHLELAAEMAAAAPDDFAASVTPVFEAIIEVESANPAAANRLAREAIAFADSQGIGEAAQMALAHSIIARTTDDPAEAVAAAKRGVELARRSPENIMLSFALTSAGAVLGVGHASDGEAFLVEARAIIDRCPDPGIAGDYLSRTEARHGLGGPQPAIGLQEELTERELAVLRYLPSQLSQRDIASELYVSLNTVKTHTKAIYRKLGVGGRKAAIQAARNRGLL